MAIQLEGAEELIARLVKLGRLEFVKAGVTAAALYVKGRLQIYPPQKTLTRKAVYGQTFKSPRQRKYFFWALKSGRIQLPYARSSAASSERFKAGWSIAVQDNGMAAVIGNDTTYGPLLMQRGLQSKYAKAVGWQDTDAVMDEERQRAVEIMQQFIEDGLAEQ